jgi:hypothetical protein
MTINELIIQLSRISEEKRNLPLVIQCPNGELTSPSIKMMWDDPFDMLDHGPDKMILTWKD